jgi:hypothetical protein
MIIIAESEADKQEILGLSKYLHDFRVYKSPVLGKTTVLESSEREVEGDKGYREKFFTLKRGDLAFLDLNNVAGNYLKHLYETPDEIEIVTLP